MLSPAAATMEIVEMVLGGRVNKSLVSLIQQSGGKAVGLSGKDGDLLRARQMIEKDIGYVGEVTRVDPTLLTSLVDSGYIPVVATVATDQNGQALNVNADTAAGEVSGSGHAASPWGIYPSAGVILPVQAPPQQPWLCMCWCPDPPKAFAYCSAGIKPVVATTQLRCCSCT